MTVPQPSRPSPFREPDAAPDVTTVLDLMGSLLLILGAALIVALWFVPAAVIVAGALLLLLSYIIDRKGQR